MDQVSALGVEKTEVSPLLRASFGPPPVEDIVPPPEPDNSSVTTGLAGYIKKCFEASRTQRRKDGVEERMLSALRAMRGEYDARTLADIREFGGSEVYSRIVSSKVRAVSAMLREIYTSDERPWRADTTPAPDTPGKSVNEAVAALLAAEVAEAQAAGVDVAPEKIQSRKAELEESAKEAKLKQARDAARDRESTLDDILVEGGFYNALWEFLQDLPAFPFAVIKGPVVRFQKRLKWDNGVPVVVDEPQMMWERASPFDVYFAPWARYPQEGYIIHKQRVNRAGLQALRGLKPTYDDAAIMRVLDGGSPRTHLEWDNYIDNERAALEETSSLDTDNGDAVDKPMYMLEFHGPVSGKLLLEWGMDKKNVPDDTQDLDISAFLIADEVIGVRLNPHPLGFKPFYVTSFERVPGSVNGHGVTDLTADVANVANATLRALVNNLAISSGPQVVMNEDRVAVNDANSRKLWPWKVHVVTNPSLGTGTERPIDFFQPTSNVQDLLAVYERFSALADEMSSVPRFQQGNPQGLGGVGRTAQGISQLMEAANRVIKQTAASIDADVIEPVIEHLNVFLALTRPDLVAKGDITIVARGAVELAQRELLRVRRLEFLNITANPVDMELTGLEGRAAILKEIARDLDLPTDQVLPKVTAAAQAAAQNQQSQGQAPNPSAPQGQGAGPQAAPQPSPQPSPQPDTSGGQ